MELEGRGCIRLPELMPALYTKKRPADSEPKAPHQPSTHPHFPLVYLPLPPFILLPLILPLAQGLSLAPPPQAPATPPLPPPLPQCSPALPHVSRSPDWTVARLPVD